jgi:hypothetical protein
MRVSVSLLASVYDKNTEEALVNPAILSAIDGWRYEEDLLYNYLDMELVDLGVVGGEIKAVWRPSIGLEVVVDYWAPATVPNAQVDALRDYTAGQLSDGIGEGGFEITVGGRDLLLLPHTDRPPNVQIIQDGVQVPLPSRIARAARDGDLRALSSAITAGESVDSLLQGYSGLHLAIIYGRPAAVLTLVQNGAYPNLLDKDGETALHLCALSNALSDSDSAMVAMTLLRYGADKALATPSGHTAISLAANRGKMETVRVLNQWRGAGEPTEAPYR